MAENWLEMTQNEDVLTPHIYHKSFQDFFLTNCFPFKLSFFALYRCTIFIQKNFFASWCIFSKRIENSDVSLVFPKERSNFSTIVGPLSPFLGPSPSRIDIYIFLSFVCHFCGHFGLFILGHFLHFVISCHCRPSLEGNLCRWPCRPFLAVLAISRCKMTLWLKMIEMAKNWPWPQPKWLKDGQKMV